MRYPGIDKPNHHPWCCFCGEPLEFIPPSKDAEFPIPGWSIWGHNPAPLGDPEGDASQRPLVGSPSPLRCCSECNRRLVIPARLRSITHRTPGPSSLVMRAEGTDGWVWEIHDTD